MENTLYPAISPYHEGQLKVSELHTLHYEQAGNPSGQPTLFLHGGPGLGILPIYRRFFDPHHYRIVLPDQRGAGRSTPYAELRENSTWEIVADLEKLRVELGIEQWQVMGGSWGSLLALCYAIKHPERVSALILRGVFLGRQIDLDWVYGGTGTAQLFPEQWQAFKAPLAKVMDNLTDADVVSTYYDLLTHQESAIAEEAALAWATFGADTMTLLPGSASSRDIKDKSKMRSLARTECHFALHNFFLPSDNYVLEQLPSIAAIPMHIVHGRYDAICPVRSAWDIKTVLPDAHLHIVADGAHIPTEAGMVDKLIEVTNLLKGD